MAVKDGLQVGWILGFVRSVMGSIEEEEAKVTLGLPHIYHLGETRQIKPTAQNRAGRTDSD